MANSLNLNLLPGLWAVCRLPAEAPLPDWAGSDELLAFIRTREELCIVCADENIPADITIERGWGLYKVQGPLDLSLVGVLASITDPPAGAGVSIFTLSTYDTDFFLVKETDLERSRLVLEQAGHKVHQTY